MQLLALVLVLALLALGRYYGIGFGGGNDNGEGGMVPELFDQSGNVESPGNSVGNTGNARNGRREEKMEYPAPLQNTNEILLVREGYTVSYNKERKIPNWVAWHLTAAHTKGGNYRDGMDFYEDMEVPSPRATAEDYHRSKYDRGHMCPSGDNKWSEKAQKQTFLYSNMCPQNHELNKGDWNDLEIQCRYWAKQMGDIYIVTGPVFYNGVKHTIGSHKVAVPDAFFKVLLDDNRKTKAIGFIYPNKPGHKDMNEYVVSVDEVERITGMDFFSMLDDRVEDNVEAASYKKMVEEWKVEKAVDYFNERNN
ncbi:MAG: DNA/RNA non-specific endonuclease [Prevotella sp.]|nr:DNA/RNA non-specific endonuclease [Prevotella sp.]